MANIDFNSLVSRTNPAAAQYQPTNRHNYPPDPERQEIFLIDDDDDEKEFGTAAPDSAFGRAPMVSMTSMNSTTPLANHGQPPAGSSWLDDDAELETPQPQMERPTLSERLKPKFKFQWPWNKEEKFVGDRIIILNDEVANHQLGYPLNYVSTSKYNVITFLPKFLAGTKISPLSLEVG